MLKNRDGKYYAIHPGESLTITFEDLEVIPTDVEATLQIGGYYIPLSLAELEGKALTDRR